MPQLDITPPLEAKTVFFWYGRQLRCRARDGETAIEAVCRRIKKIEGCDRLFVAHWGCGNVDIQSDWYIVEFAGRNSDLWRQGLVIIPLTQENMTINVNGLLGKVPAPKGREAV